MNIVLCTGLLDFLPHRAWTNRGMLSLLHSEPGLLKRVIDGALLRHKYLHEWLEVGQLVQYCLHWEKLDEQFLAIFYWCLLLMQFFDHLGKDREVALVSWEFATFAHFECVLRFLLYHGQRIFLGIVLSEGIIGHESLLPNQANVVFARVRPTRALKQGVFLFWPERALAL